MFSQLNRIGLRYDDMVPDNSYIIKEALRRLPEKELMERTFRFRRALSLSLIKQEAPKDEWTTTAQVILQL